MADCKALASTLRRDLLRPLCIFNFGEDRRIPYIRFDCGESQDLTQTAEILGTLIEKTGLRVPASFIYRKFSIPVPEAGEEIAVPRGAGGAGMVPFREDLPAGRIPLKSGTDSRDGSQARIDRLVEAAAGKGARCFKHAFAPVLKAVERAESLEELKDMMEDDQAVAELFREMDVSEIESLLQKAMVYADLEGRTLEDG